jgi:hypothetical protein
VSAGEEDTYVPAPSRERMLTKSRLREIRALAGRAPEARLRRLYAELYGATAGTGVSIDRMRASLAEACDELLGRCEP